MQYARCRWWLQWSSALSIAHFCDEKELVVVLAMHINVNDHREYPYEIFQLTCSTRHERRPRKKMRQFDTKQNNIHIRDMDRWMHKDETSVVLVNYDWSLSDGRQTYATKGYWHSPWDGRTNTLHLLHWRSSSRDGVWRTGKVRSSITSKHEGVAP